MQVEELDQEPSDKGKWGKVLAVVLAAEDEEGRNESRLQGQDEVRRHFCNPRFPAARGAPHPEQEAVVVLRPDPEVFQYPVVLPMISL